VIKKVTDCILRGVKLVELDSFNDFRGYYQETYNLKEYQNYV